MEQRYCTWWLCRRPTSETQLLLHADALVSWRADMTLNRKRAWKKERERRLNKWLQIRKCQVKAGCALTEWKQAALNSVLTQGWGQQLSQPRRRCLFSFINHFWYIKYDHFMLWLLHCNEWQNRAEEENEHYIIWHHSPELLNPFKITWRKKCLAHLSSIPPQQTFSENEKYVKIRYLGK